jgi:hypothetical protein
MSAITNPSLGVATARHGHLQRYGFVGVVTTIAHLPARSHVPANGLRKETASARLQEPATGMPQTRRRSDYKMRTGHRGAFVTSALLPLISMSVITEASQEHLQNSWE